MHKFLVIYDGTNYTRAWLEALIWACEQFREYNYEIEFLGREDFAPRGVYIEIPMTVSDIINHKPDTILCAFHDAGFLGDPNTQIELLSELREQCANIIWLDVADSTGDCNFSLLPYVDRYLKGQILKEPEQYLTGMYGGRTFTDFYHRTMGIQDDNCINNPKPMLKDIKDIEKVGISWNFGLSKVSYEFDRKIPDVHRRIDVFYRGSYFNSITHIQRKFSIDIIDDLKEKNMTVVDPRERVSKKQFVDELYDSKLVLSPFGWGELCGRDFETFVAGAVLIKPRVDHMITYPDCFLENETYIPIEWDFSNFDDVISIVNDPKRMIEIASLGQNRYYSFSRGDDAKDKFVRHFLHECRLSFL